MASNTGLYNAPGNDPVVPDKYVQQFGEYVAAKHQSEIASVSSDTTAKDENWAALQGRTNSGLVDVTGAEVLDVLPAGRTAKFGITLGRTLEATAREAEESIAGGLAKAVSQDASRTGVPQWTVAVEDGYGARLAGSYKAGDTAYNGAAASDSAYGFNFGLTARESGAATRSDISDAMRADPYHPDWKSYVGGEARAVGADVTRTSEASLSSGNPANQSELEIIAKVNGGRAPFSEINGAIGEARGWGMALESGQLPISGPGKASMPGADYITYDPSTRSVVVWDAKYRAPGGSYPSSLPAAKLEAWQAEILNSVKNMPDGQSKVLAENALKAGRVEGRIFKWPQ